jgi:hypothetical protein
MENYLEIVQNLNERIYDTQFKLDFSVEFGYSTNGHMHVIDVNQHRLWFSEEDGREFFEETNSYEDLEQYVWNQFVKYIQDLNTLINE